VTLVHNTVDEFLNSICLPLLPPESEAIRFHMSLDQNTPLIVYRALFVVDEAGQRTYFLTTLMEYLSLTIISYYDEVHQCLMSSCRQAMELSPEDKPIFEETKRLAAEDAMISLRDLHDHWVELDPGQRPFVEEVIHFLAQQIPQQVKGTPVSSPMGMSLQGAYVSLSSVKKALRCSLLLIRVTRKREKSYFELTENLTSNCFADCRVRPLKAKTSSVRKLPMVPIGQKDRSDDVVKLFVQSMVKAKHRLPVYFKVVDPALEGSRRKSRRYSVAATSL